MLGQLQKKLRGGYKLTDTLTAAKRKIPDANSHITEPFTKLYFVSKDKTIESLGFPDSVRESPAEIVELSKVKTK